MSAYEYVAVVGSRNYPDPQEVLNFVRGLDPKRHVVVSGGAPGVDTWAADEAERLGIHTCVIKALWDVYRKPAGHIRNPIIMDVAHRAQAFRFGGEESRGTTGAIQCANRAGTPIEVRDA